MTKSVCSWGAIRIGPTSQSEMAPPVSDFLLHLLDSFFQRLNSVWWIGLQPEHTHVFNHAEFPIIKSYVIHKIEYYNISFLIIYMQSHFMKIQACRLGHSIAKSVKFSQTLNGL